MAPDELTPEEREAIENLGREWRGSDMLEERVVRSLRAEGLLRAPRQRWFAPAPARWVMVAACLCLMVVSYLAGHRVGARHESGSLPFPSGSGAEATVWSVQQTGDAYLEALQALALHQAAMLEMNGHRGQRAALATLHAAAGEILRIAPDDRVSSYILQAFDQVPGAFSRARSDTTQLVWF